MRDRTKLTAFQLADALALNTYRKTASFPREEIFGLTSQMRRAAVSVPSNIVEGCARHSEADYTRLLDVGYASSRELAYQASLASRLGYFAEDDYAQFALDCDEVCRVLSGLITSLRGRE
jgi:four helix bundle protein